MGIDIIKNRLGDIIDAQIYIGDTSLYEEEYNSLHKELFSLIVDDSVKCGVFTIKRR